MYVGTGDDFKLTQGDDECGQKFFTLAFIIADKSNNPAWDGHISMGKTIRTAPEGTGKIAERTRIRK